jgi:hypothetical protein
VKGVSSSVWLWALAVVLALFTLGHTLGTASPKARRGASESMVFFAMQSYRFPVLGFERSYWDFYRGFALTVSVLMAVMAIVAWQVAAIARRHPAEALPVAMTLLVGSVGLLVLGWMFFFTAPIVLSLAAVGCAGMAVTRLRAELRARG